MQIVCIIASHLSTTDRANWLHECLLSTLEGLKADKIILSFYGNVKPIIPHNHKIQILEQSRKMYQFEHIESTLHLIDDNDIVVLMDDDDLFLPESRSIIESLITKGAKCSEGTSYHGFFANKNVNNFNWIDIKDHDLSKFNITLDHDFPGTFCFGKHLKHYFQLDERNNSWEKSKRLDQYSKGEEDCVFTQCYIQMLDGFVTSEIPWIFHRHHSLKRDY